MIRSFAATLTTILVFSFAAGAQSTEAQLEKLAKDPKTAERAAKADVYIMGHKIMNDSTNTDFRKCDGVQMKKKRKGCKKS